MVYDLGLTPGDEAYSSTATLTREANRALQAESLHPQADGSVSSYCPARFPIAVASKVQPGPSGLRAQ